MRYCQKQFLIVQIVSRQLVVRLSPLFINPFDSDNH